MRTVSALFTPELLFLADAEGRRHILAPVLTSGLFGSARVAADDVTDVGGAALATRSALGATLEDAALSEVRSALRALPATPDRLRVARIVAQEGTLSAVLIGLSSRESPGCLLLFSLRPDGSMDVVLPGPGEVIPWSTVFDRLEDPDLVMLERAASASSDTFAWSNGVIGQRRSGGGWEEKARGVPLSAYTDRALSLLGEVRA